MVVEEVNDIGKPILPEGISARFRNTCGAIARDKLQTWITTNDWKKIPNGVKDAMWAALEACFRFPEGKPKDDAKKFALSTMGAAFRNFRSTLTTDYLEKGKCPRKKYGKIPISMWEEFKAQKQTPAAIALREKMKEKAQKAAKNAHCLGVGGYDGKIPHWRREEEERRKEGLPDLFAGIDERAKHWCLARRKRRIGNQIVFDNPTTAEIYARLGQVVKAQRKGLFTADREKDQLTEAIGIPEHSGCVRGVSSKLPWKKASANDPGYKKRDRYQKTLEAKMRAIAKEELSQLLASQQGSLVSNSTQSNLGLMVVQSGLVAPSSVESITQHRYPVDDIRVDTPCTLVVPYGRKQNKFRQVATGMALTGHVFPSAPAPEYAWVQINTMMDATLELDIATDDGIEVLGDAMNQYVQWHRRDILLQGVSSQEQPPPLPPPEANIVHQKLSPVPEVNHEEDQTAHQGTNEIPARLQANIEAEGANMPSPQAPPKLTSSSNEKETVDDDLSFEEPILETYVHGKPFLPYMDLHLGPCELVDFHAWIMKAMKKGITAITAMIPREVFHNPRLHQLVIDFDDLHALYRRKHLDVNLITVWSLMQALEAEKHKVAYLDPARIHKTEHSFKLNEEVKGQLAAAKTKKVISQIQAEAHKKERCRVTVYITRVMMNNTDKDYIYAAYGFDNHWIGIILMPKVAQAVVLDSGNYERK
ncbi:unnamed protein product [Urochloa humidicola]